MARPKPDEHIRDDALEWAYEATTQGILCLRTLVLSIERGDVDLPIDLHAWENTMAALEWTLARHVAGVLHTEPPLTQEHLERARRVRALGSSAIVGAERSPELAPLADACLSSLISGWRTAFPGLPVGYPVPGGQP